MVVSSVCEDRVARLPVTREEQRTVTKMIQNQACVNAISRAPFWQRFSGLHRLPPKIAEHPTRPNVPIVALGDSRMMLVLPNG
jgi:hypothetical protein